MVICTALLFFFCVNLRACHCKQLIPPFAKTSSFYNSLFVSSATLRNSLPAPAVLCPSINSFMNSVHIHGLLVSVQEHVSFAWPRQSRENTPIKRLTKLKHCAPTVHSKCWSEQCRIACVPFLIPTDIGVTCTPLHIASYPSIQCPTIWTEVRICQTLLYKANSWQKLPWVTQLKVIVWCIWFAWEPIELLNFTAFTTD